MFKRIHEESNMCDRLVLHLTTYMKHDYYWMGGCSNHFARNPVPLQSLQQVAPFPAQMTQLEFLEGTSHSMLSPRMKNPVPPHHLHSTCPLDSQEEQATGLGCWEINQACSIRLRKPLLLFEDEFSKDEDSTIEAFTTTTQRPPLTRFLIRFKRWGL